MCGAAGIVVFEDEQCSLSTNLLIGQPTNSKGKMCWCLPKMFFIASFIGTQWMWSSDSWREAEETQESHLDSRPVSDPEWPFYNLLQSQQVQSTVCSCTVLILQSTVSTCPQCPQCLPQCPQCPIHSVDSTNYSLNRSSLQSGLVQLSRTVLFIRSSRVKEVWLAKWNSPNQSLEKIEWIIWNQE